MGNVLVDFRDSELKAYIKVDETQLKKRITTYKLSEHETKDITYSEVRAILALQAIEKEEQKDLPPIVTVLRSDEEYYRELALFLRKNSAKANRGRKPSRNDNKEKEKFINS